MSGFENGLGQRSYLRSVSLSFSSENSCMASFLWLWASFSSFDWDFSFSLASRTSWAQNGEWRKILRFSVWLWGKAISIQEISLSVFWVKTGNLVAVWCARSPFLSEQQYHCVCMQSYDTGLSAHHQQWQMTVSLSRSKIILKSFLKPCLSSRPSHGKFKSVGHRSCLQPTLGKQYLHWQIENSTQRRANTQGSTLCRSSLSCEMVFICFSRVLMCLDESSRSLRADDTSSSCFSSWPESAHTHAHTHIYKGLEI